LGLLPGRISALAVEHFREKWNPVFRSKMRPARKLPERNTMDTRRICGTLIVSALLAGSAASAVAQPVADFYKGKRVNLVIGYGTGGGYDVYARLLGRFIGDHIPGKPTIV